MREEPLSTRYYERPRSSFEPATASSRLLVHVFLYSNLPQNSSSSGRDGAAQSMRSGSILTLARLSVESSTRTAGNPGNLDWVEQEKLPWLEQV